MLKLVTAALLVGILIAGCATSQPTAEKIRIDASSETTAKASYKAIQRTLSEPEKRELALAVLKIGLEDTRSVRDAMKLPDPSIENIRHKVAGLTAEGIIQRAAHVKSIQVESPGN